MDHDKHQYYAAVIGNIPIEAEQHFTEVKRVDQQRFSELEKEQQWSQAEHMGSIINHLRSYFDCDQYYTFRCVVRGEDVWEVTSYLYCIHDAIPKCREPISPWRSDFLRHVFGNRVVHVDDFKDDSKNPIRIVIPSVIHTSTTNIRNSMNRRSVFSSDERYQQLLAQLQDLENTYADIYVLEGSRPHLSQLREISKYATVILFYNTEGDYYANHHFEKSYFEFYSIYRMLELFSEYQWFIKFGARYRITNPSIIYKICSNVPKMKLYQPHRTYINTTQLVSVLFSYPYSYAQRLKDRLEQQLSDDSEIIASESVFYDPDAQHVPNLHIHGLDEIGRAHV